MARLPIEGRLPSSSYLSAVGCCHWLLLKERCISGMCVHVLGNAMSATGFRFQKGDMVSRGVYG